MVNTVQQAGYGLPGEGATTGDPGIPFFQGEGAVGLKINPALTAAGIAASASGNANDGNNALAISQLRARTVIGQSNLGDSLGAWLGQVGQAAQAASAQAESATTVLDGLDSQRTSSNSVNSDEEMIDIIKFQRSYQACARVISVADSLMDTLINRTAV
jgi:flagellar hook-associated protein 1 FlgK